MTIQITSYAQTLNMQNITTNLQGLIKTHLKGQNKPIIQDIYKQTGNKPLWVGSQNKKR